MIEPDEALGWLMAAAIAIACWVTLTHAGVF